MKMYLEHGRIWNAPLSNTCPLVIHSQVPDVFNSCISCGVLDASGEYLAIGSNHGEVWIFFLKQNRYSRVPCRKTSPHTPVTCLSFYTNEQDKTLHLLIGCLDRLSRSNSVDVVEVMSLSSLSRTQVALGPSSEISQIIVTRDNHIVTVSSAQIVLWQFNRKGLRRVSVYRSEDRRIRSAALCGHRMFIVTDESALLAGSISSLNDCVLVNRFSQDQHLRKISISDNRMVLAGPKDVYLMDLSLDGAMEGNTIDRFTVGALAANMLQVSLMTEHTLLVLTEDGIVTLLKFRDQDCIPIGSTRIVGGSSLVGVGFSYSLEGKFPLLLLHEAGTWFDLLNVKLLLEQSGSIKGGISLNRVRDVSGGVRDPAYPDRMYQVSEPLSGVTSGATSPKSGIFYIPPELPFDVDPAHREDLYKLYFHLPLNERAYALLRSNGAQLEQEMTSWRKIILSDQTNHVYVIKSERTTNRLIEMLGMLSLWNPQLSPTNNKSVACILPGMVFPFVKLFGRSKIFTFELVVTMLRNFFSSWVAPTPVELVRYIDTALTENALSLHNHLIKVIQPNTTHSPGYILFSTLCATLLTEKWTSSCWIKLIDLVAFYVRNGCRQRKPTHLLDSIICEYLILRTNQLQQINNFDELMNCLASPDELLQPSDVKQIFLNAVKKISQADSGEPFIVIPENANMYPVEKDINQKRNHLFTHLPGY